MRTKARCVRIYAALYNLRNMSVIPVHGMKRLLGSISILLACPTDLIPEKKGEKVLLNRVKEKERM